MFLWTKLVDFWSLWYIDFMKSTYADQIKKLREKRDGEIIKLRDKKKTLKEIGDMFGISDENVRRIIRKENTAKTNNVDTE